MKRGKEEAVVLYLEDSVVTEIRNQAPGFIVSM